MFHTGLHNDYHRPSDDADRINHEGLRTAAQVTLYTLLSVADADRLPTFRQQALRESVAVQQQLEQPVPANAARYGFPFKADNEEGEPLRLVLTGVNPGSPAEKAGFKAGDQLISFQGQPIENAQRFRLQLLAATGETTFAVEREGVAEPFEIKVTPLGNPVRIGITWRMDEGEPGTALITQVTFGSAAQAAGLKLKDRIYSVAGHAFTTQDEFSRLLRETPSPIELVIERSGKVQTVQLEVLDDGLPAAE
jgi:S1-C subfamily serine protease